MILISLMLVFLYPTSAVTPYLEHHTLAVVSIICCSHSFASVMSLAGPGDKEFMCIRL